MDKSAKPHGKKILLVDDDAFLLEVYGRKFQEEGFDVSVSNDGQEAWDLIQGGYRPDVVFTGILMPRMTGFDLIQKMQADKSLAGIPVAISSHRGRDEDREKAKILQVDDFIVHGSVPLLEMVRRISLLVGIRHAYKIPLDRRREEDHALIRLLETQMNVHYPPDKEKLSLILEPQLERGEFKATLGE